MIERNLGNIERIVRLALSVLLFAWVSAQPYITLTEWFVTGIGLCLMLNGIFSRCYLWYVLDLNTCNKPQCKESLC